MAIVITPAQPADLQDLVELFREMEEFYGEDESVETMAANINRALFDPERVSTALIARVGDKVAGFAAYTFLWPSYGSTRSLFLKELYVLAEHRRRGVADALMEEVTRTAEALNCDRVEWTTDESNTAAQAFYAARRSTPYSGKLNYRISLRSN
jgi:ribosomal protein S18 acetylase RimI-like enzyme